MLVISSTSVLNMLIVCLANLDNPLPKPPSTKLKNRIPICLDNNGAPILPGVTMREMNNPYITKEVQTMIQDYMREHISMLYLHYHKSRYNTSLRICHWPTRKGCSLEKDGPILHPTLRKNAFHTASSGLTLQESQRLMSFASCITGEIALVKGRNPSFG